MISMCRFEKFADDIRGIVNSWAFTVVVLPVVLVWKLLINNPADPDIFARVAMGRLVLRDGAVPTIDPFAFTQKYPTWIDHEWLSGVVFYLTAVVGGDFGLTLLKLVFAVGSTLCFTSVCLHYARSILVGVAVRDASDRGVDYNDSLSEFYLSLYPAALPGDRTLPGA